MKKVDCLFLHPTTHVKMSHPNTADSLTYVIMPMGTLALADILDKEGYETKIVHTGIERMCNRLFTIESLFKDYEVSVVAIDLHWYVHSYDAIRIADIVKQCSNAFVVLGGFTATFFAQEILLQFNNIDAIVSGDAEVPLLGLVKQLAKGQLEEVPNLTYRDGTALKQNDRRYLADESDLDRLDFSNFHLLSNFSKYRTFVSQLGDLDPFAHKAKLKTQGWLCLGRGCSMNCSYCGGGENSFRILTGRNKPVYRSTQKVVETLARFEEAKISCAYMDFDPFPSKRDYYQELFALIREERIDISAEFLLWSISDKGFLSDFKRTFNPLYSTIALSPESGSESVRKLNKGFYYSNEELFRWLDDVKSEIIPLQLYFSSGLSGETKDSFEDTIKVGKRAVERYPVVSASCNPIELEPACPRFIYPKKYGIVPSFTRFTDYYDAFRKLAEGLPVTSRLGYRTDWLSEPEIIELSQRFREVVRLAEYEKWRKVSRGEVLRLKKT